MKKAGYLFSKPARAVLIVLILTIVLCAMGVSYAAWSDYLKVNSFLSAGSFSIVFAQDNSYDVAVVDASGVQVGSSIDSENIKFTLDNRQKQARICLSSSLLLEELVAPGRYLMLRYPLAVDKGSTVKSIMPYQDDLNAASKEEIRFSMDSAQLLFNGDEYSLSTTGQSFATPLYWDVYRKIELENDNIIGIVLLRLRPESIANAESMAQVSMDVAELPLEAVEQLIPDGDGIAGPLPAEIKATYSFSVPLYVEQGR